MYMDEMTVKTKMETIETLSHTRLAVTDPFYWSASVVTPERSHEKRCSPFFK